jgi:hypothetical protein
LLGCLFISARALPVTINIVWFAWFGVNVGGRVSSSLLKILLMIDNKNCVDFFNKNRFRRRVVCWTCRLLSALQALF